MCQKIEQCKRLCFFVHDESTGGRDSPSQSEITRFEEGLLRTHSRNREEKGINEFSRSVTVDIRRRKRIEKHAVSLN